MFKKIILGLGLLGVVSSANAWYIEIPGHYDETKYYVQPKIVPAYNLKNYERADLTNITTTYGVSWVSTKVGVIETVLQTKHWPNTAFVPGSSGVNATAVQTILYSINVLTKNNGTPPYHPIGCKNKLFENNVIGSGYTSTRFENCSEKVYPIMKEGSSLVWNKTTNVYDMVPDTFGTTYDDASLKSENALIKARLQALETKVYSCVP